MPVTRLLDQLEGVIGPAQRLLPVTLDTIHRRAMETALWDHWREASPAFWVLYSILPSA